MTDVLTVLHSLMHRVSSVLMPSELSDVLQFLRGNHWRLVENGAQTVTPTSTATATNAASATSASLPTRKQSRYVPDGRVAHHGFIPLAIAADALLSLASGGERAALEQLFSRHGFERVVAVNLCPSGMASRADGASEGGSAFGEVGRGVESVGHDGAAASAATTLNSIRPGQRRRRGQREGETVWQTIEAENTTAGRLTCVDIIRTWLAEVEEEARRVERQRHVSRRRDVDRAHIRTQDSDAPQRTETRAIGCDADDADSTRRLLLLVRCTADNRELAVSTASSSAGAGSARFGPSRSARRLTERADPLFLLLHDLAAAQTLSQVRLTHIGGAATAHIAVLLLPDDHIYGGILLQQRLRRELAYRYVTRLFEDSDDLSITARPADRPSSTTTSATTGGEKKSSDGNGVSLRLSTRWARTGRLLDLWEPGWAARLATPAGTPDTDLTSVVNDAVSEVPGAGCVTDAMLERHLLRRCGDGAFFLRPSNLPLCAFLREALLRFPLLLRPAHLQLLQAAWTSRHALVDVMWVFHALQMPFDFTTGADANSGAAPEPSSDAHAPVRTTSSPSAFATCRQRTSFSDVYRDTTCLLDALLEVAATLRTRGANGQGRAAAAAATGVAGGEEASAAAALDEAVAFMLLVDEVSRQQSYIHVLQAAPITKALAEIYRREVHAWAMRRAEASVLPHTADSARIQAVKALEAPFLALSEGEQARHTLLYQLPFHQPSPLCGGSHGHTIADNGTASRADDAPRWPVRLPAVMRVTGVRLSVAGALQSAALSAALAPDASLRELVELTGGLVKAVSPHNFYSPLIPSTVRVMHVLAVHALRASLEREKHVPLAQLQHVCQLSDDVLLVTLHELQSVGFIAVNSFRQTARSLLSG